MDLTQLLTYGYELETAEIILEEIQYPIYQNVWVSSTEIEGIHSLCIMSEAHEIIFEMQQKYNLN